MIENRIFRLLDKKEVYYKIFGRRKLKFIFYMINLKLEFYEFLKCTRIEKKVIFIETYKNQQKRRRLGLNKFKI